MSSQHRPPKAALGLEPLEAREVPAALHTFNPITGQLAVTIDGDVRTGQQAVIDQRGGVVYLNGTRTNVPSQAVKGITVTGSRFDNYISLSGVTTAGFSGLDGRVAVSGGDGKDVINGSGFADHLRGGAKDDTIKGRDGDDRIWGDAGNDQLEGMAGNDRMDGGAGDDNFYGGDGDDLMVGRGGRDYFAGERNTDTAWIDNADLPPGKQNERIRRGTPPTI